jgi:hypothetical protein
MDNKPHALTREELKEIAAIADVQQMWGAENAADMEAFLEDTVYAVKFDFVSGSPGYVGDYFILAGDALGEPVQLIRKDGKLALL